MAPKTTKWPFPSSTGVEEATEAPSRSRKRAAPVQSDPAEVSRFDPLAVLLPTVNTAASRNAKAVANVKATNTGTKSKGKSVKTESDSHEEVLWPFPRAGTVVPEEPIDRLKRVYGLREEDLLGAHLISPRSLYTHHGIYVGNGRVVHYSGLSSGIEAGPVTEVDLRKFSSGRDIYLQVPKKVVFTGEEIVSRARSRLGEDLYNIFFNNCEHFCWWCATGESQSPQVVDTTFNLTVATIARYSITAIAGSQVAAAVLVGAGIYKIVIWFRN